MGVHRSDGSVLLCPAADLVLEEDDDLVVIADSPDQITWAEHEPCSLEPPYERDIRPRETVVLCGWNQLTARIARELDHYLPSGSHIDVLVEATQKSAAADGLSLQLNNATLELYACVARDHAPLLHRLCGRADHVMILSPVDAGTASEADARALVTMLAAREAIRRSGRNATLVTELLDERNAELAPRASAADFIISERLSSLLLTQVAENQHLAEVYGTLLAPEGGQLYCKPLHAFTSRCGSVRFAELVRAGAERGECVIGYRILAAANEPLLGFGVVLNPRRDHVAQLTGTDQLLVVSSSTN